MDATIRKMSDRQIEDQIKLAQADYDGHASRGFADGEWCEHNSECRTRAHKLLMKLYAERNRRIQAEIARLQRGFAGKQG